MLNQKIVVIVLMDTIFMMVGAFKMINSVLNFQRQKKNAYNVDTPALLQMENVLVVNF